MQQLKRSMHAAHGDSLATENVACRACDKASGIWDVRHAFNANIVYELPFGSGKAFLNQPGILWSVFGSWQLTSILGAYGFFRSTPLLSAAELHDRFSWHFESSFDF